MVSSRILKRRKRAQLGTLLAVLLILMPLPVGAYVYGQMTDLQDQSVVFSLDDKPNDPMLDQSLVTYDNVTDTYTYNKTKDDGTSQGTYTTDLKHLNLGYVNSSQVEHVSPNIPFSVSDNKIFHLFEQSESDTDSSLTFGQSMLDWSNPNIGYVTVVSPDDMLENNVDTVRVYFENNQELNLSFCVGVYDPDAVTGTDYEYNRGVTYIGAEGFDGCPVAGLYNIVHTTGIVSSPNGSWVDIEIPDTNLLTAATSHGDGYVFLTVIDADGAVLEETNGILVGMEMIGSDDSPTSMTGIWQAALVAIGLFGLVGAIIATPYMSIEGLTGDGMQGQRYKKGYNPRKYNNKRRK